MKSVIKHAKMTINICKNEIISYIIYKKDKDVNHKHRRTKKTQRQSEHLR